MSRIVCRACVSIILLYVPNVYCRGGKNIVYVLVKRKKKENDKLLTKIVEKSFFKKNRLLPFFFHFSCITLISCNHRLNTLLSRAFTTNYHPQVILGQVRLGVLVYGDTILWTTDFVPMCLQQFLTHPIVLVLLTWFLSRL